MPRIHLSIMTAVSGCAEDVCVWKGQGGIWGDYGYCSMLSFIQCVAQ